MRLALANTPPKTATNTATTQRPWHTNAKSRAQCPALLDIDLLHFTHPLPYHAGLS